MIYLSLYPKTKVLIGKSFGSMFGMGESIGLQGELDSNSNQASYRFQDAFFNRRAIFAAKTPRCQAKLAR